MIRKLEAPERCPDCVQAQAQAEKLQLQAVRSTKQLEFSQASAAVFLDQDLPIRWSVVMAFAK